MFSELNYERYTASVNDDISTFGRLLFGRTKEFINS